ncbi:hypothetical protein E4U42_003953 [Claviceps africana]|uniref:Uncharacterized protein n=1 Tax=Claviceps africana TaxID=83212 RepID=A0A8K0J661_9HYPO|nr:hypothetical protein E4U42_003953 [Claviceps africana]
MASNIPCYFYAPNWDFPPDGPIKLGNVLMSIKKPDRALHAAAVPSSFEVVSTKRRVEFSHKKLKTGGFSILMRFLSSFGFGFVPTTAFLEGCLAAPAVKRYLQSSRYRKPIYIITGLKTVTGAAVRTSKIHGVGGNLGAEVDGTIWSGGTVPVRGRPDFAAQIEDTDSAVWEDDGSFVFAYKVSKVWVKKEDVVEEEYRKGAMLSAQHVELEDAPLRIVREQSDPEEEGYVKEVVREGDEYIVCAIPQN